MVSLSLSNTKNRNVYCIGCKGNEEFLLYMSTYIQQNDNSHQLLIYSCHLPVVVNSYLTQRRKPYVSIVDGSDFELYKLILGLLLLFIFTMINSLNDI